MHSIRYCAILCLPLHTPCSYHYFGKFYLFPGRLFPRRKNLPSLPCLWALLTGRKATTTLLSLPTHLIVEGKEGRKATCPCCSHPHPCPGPHYHLLPVMLTTIHHTWRSWRKEEGGCLLCHSHRSPFLTCCCACLPWEGGGGENSLGGVVMAFLGGRWVMQACAGGGR